MTGDHHSSPRRRMPDLLEDPLLRAYLSSVRDWHGYIRFLGLPDRRDNRDIIIDRLYVDPLLTHRHVSPEEEPEDWIREAETAVDALSFDKPLVVLGDPGAGKSTLTNYLVWLLSHPSSSSLVDRMGWRLPVPMVLRELQLRGVRDFDGLVDAFLGHAMSKPLRHHDYLSRALSNGDAFIILDGIDEIGDPKDREDLRRAVFDGFDRFPKCRWMLTSRIIGYSEAPFDSYVPRIQAESALEIKRHGPDTPVRTRFIAPFDDRRIQAFAGRWYAQRVAGKVRAQAQARDLVRAIHEDKAILRLARVPNLLTMMALIHRIEATLPHGRSLLYDRISEAYLESIDRYRGLQSGAVDLPHKKLWLSRVAYELQRRRERTEGRKDSELLVRTDDVLRWIDDAMTQGGHAASVNSSQEFLDFVRRRSGLFLQRGEDTYAFVHLSFQEYFAAVALEREVTGVDWALGRPTTLGVTAKAISLWARQSVWRETLLFLFELLASKQDWHHELQRRIFGDQFSVLNGFDRKDISNVSFLLARLVVNPQSGLHPNREQAATKACLRVELGRFQMNSEEEPGSDALAVLLSRDDSRNKLVLDMMAQQASDLKCKSIRLRGTQISDIGPLADLPWLEHLDLTETGISDVASLARIVSLRRLDLMNTKVFDISPLSSLTSLHILDLMNTEVSDLSPLSDLRSLAWIDVSGTAVSSVQSLRHLTRLTHLRCARTTLTDLSPLIGATSLRMLDLTETKVTDVSPISGFRLLERVDLMDSSVSDIQPLAGLVSLDSLDLMNTPVKDLTPLQRLLSLTHLDLKGTEVSDITPLRELKSLSFLNLMNTQVSDVRALMNLSSLDYLDLMNTPVSDVSALSRLSYLTWLDLSGTAVSDIAPLAELDSLQQLFVPNRVSENAVQQLKEALPRCRIDHFPSG